jgi:hypothetical protein
LPAQSPPAHFDELVCETQGPLYGFVRGLMGGHEQARDVVPDVYFDAWRGVLLHAVAYCTLQRVCEGARNGSRHARAAITAAELMEATKQSMTCALVGTLIY